MSCSFAISWTVDHQALLFMGFPRQEYRSDCHGLLLGIFPTQGLNSHLLHFRLILYHWVTRPLSHYWFLEVIGSYRIYGFFFFPEYFKIKTSATEGQKILSHTRTYKALQVRLSYYQTVSRGISNFHFYFLSLSTALCTIYLFKILPIPPQLLCKL